MTDYGASYHFSEFESALIYACMTGDQSRLRKCPEGRKFLLGEALERRKLPLEVRMFPRLAGERMAKTIDDAAFKVLMGGER